ncbi:single-stranded DNA-binding protein [candidate division KSB1 bacterium]|nr:single-stranded DNA-binding protein [candidate division KSB1 bacterium]RQW07601.1 MAG: single-stranded DNA-binding protein [candidate division KSB1 bacterium]
MAYDSKGTVNKVILIGRLGQDPELKYTPSGAAVLTLSIATNTSYKGQDGNNVENTEWNRVVVWRKLAEIIAQYAKKGTRVYVEGKLTTRNWDDQNGVKHYMTEVVADQIQLLESRGESPSHSSAEAPPPPHAQAAEPTPEEGDDLPF